MSTPPVPGCPANRLTAYTEQARHLEWDVEASLLPSTYVEVIVRSGGVPVPLPPVNGAAAALVGALDRDLPMLAVCRGAQLLNVALAGSLTQHLPDVLGHHHQALGQVAEDLDVVGWARDGTVEAVELPGRTFVVGVQWYSEEDPADDRLFAALVAACARAQQRW
ncbi:MAG: gamma-glutamyl-gamma-aminobutyrate hydrolase family protein [Pseudonocardiaceae bacterium]